MRYYNTPPKGSSTVVDPIRKPEDIGSIKKLLSDNPRNLLLFTLGINNGIRTGDLLQLRARDVMDKKTGEAIQIRESKTGKQNWVFLNKESHRILKSYLSIAGLENEDFLFKSRKGGNRPLTTNYVNRLIKGWCKAINLPGNYGAHSLRKTFGYIQRTRYGVGFEILCKRFNHGSPHVTMRYLGISDSEVFEILQNEV